MNTISLTPGMLALPSIRCDTLMSWTVNTNESMPQPMGRMAASHTPRTRSYIVTSPALPSICAKSAASTPSVPIDLSMSVCPANIQLQVSRSTPHSHALMSSAIPANAGAGRARDAAHARTVRENASENPRLPTAFAIVSLIVAP